MALALLVAPLLLLHGGDKLQVTVLKKGTGYAAKKGDRITVDYTGKLANGTVFDSSKKPGRTPFAFVLGASEVIKGWDQGLVGAKKGEKLKLVIPYALAYGEAGYGPIPPKATLTFTIDVVKIEKVAK